MSTTVAARSRRESHLSRQNIQGLIRKNPELFFATNRDEVYQFLALLLHSTTLPSDATSTQVVKTIVALEEQLERGYPRREFSRFVNIRVAQLLPQLKQAVKEEVKCGKLCTSKGRGITTIAIDLYSELAAVRSRQAIRHRWRISNRWNILSSGSPILPIVFADAAEAVMYVHKMPISIKLTPF